MTNTSRNIHAGELKTTEILLGSKNIVQMMHIEAQIKLNVKNYSNLELLEKIETEHMTWCSNERDKL